MQCHSCGLNQSGLLIAHGIRQEEHAARKPADIFCKGARMLQLTADANFHGSVCAAVEIAHQAVGTAATGFIFRILGVSDHAVSFLEAAAAGIIDDAAVLMACVDAQMLRSLLPEMHIRTADANICHPDDGAAVYFRHRHLTNLDFPVPYPDCLLHEHGYTCPLSKGYHSI